MKSLTTFMALALAWAGGASPTPAAKAQEPADPNLADFTGNWLGSLNIGGTTLRLRFVLAEGDDGLTAELFSLDQGNVQVPVGSTTMSGATITVSMPAIGASYEGSLSTEDGNITGTFSQAGADFPLVLERVSEEDLAPRRPQNPVEPYPYLAEDVTWPNPDGGHTLAGTFTRPADGGPFPAVVLISGSGPQDRDEALMDHRPFLVLADHLTRRGIAVLRYDDRGVGESTGNFGTATTPDFASDALAAVAYLKTRDDVNPDAIGLAGHSEGGVVAPIAAVESDDVSYIVLMAGTGVNGERILYTQAALILRAGGASEEAIADNRARQERIFEVLKSESDRELAAQAIEAIMRTSLETASDEELAQAGIPDSASADLVIASQVQQVNTPWFRYFLTYEPATMLERVTVPVLAINGEKDLQVPWEENLREIEAALLRGGNTSYEIRSFPDLNHLFQHSETGAPSEYQAIEETWSVEVMEVIADWILGTTARTPPP